MNRALLSLPILPLMIGMLHAQPETSPEIERMGKMAQQYHIEHAMGNPPSGGDEIDAMRVNFIPSPGAGVNFGYSVASAGDVNGDGFADVIVGADAYSSYTGRAYIYFGGTTMNTAPDVILTGETANSTFGYAVSSAGDVNGDGYADVIVGAYGHASTNGRAYIYFGGAAMDNVPDVILNGESVSSFGISVSTAGDVNGDGYADVIVGARAYSNNTGRGYIFFGGAAMNNVADVTMTGTAQSDYFGASVSTAGDVNGDGYDDVIVGSYGYSNFAGRSCIYFGGATVNNVADVILIGQADGDAFGTSASTAGDVNGDGYDDVIVGAPSANSFAGRAYVYFGGSSMNTVVDVTMTGEGTGSYFGGSVANAGDVNGDGYDDVIVGAYSYSGNTGRAYMYFGGAAMNNTVDAIVTGESGGNSFAYSVASAGDMNGDGYADVIVGAYGYSSFAGRAYVYFNALTGTDLPDYSLTGETTSNYFGVSVSAAGDVNGDGYADVIVGAYGYSSNTGRAYIYFGGPGMDNIPDVILTGETTDNRFGTSVSTAGDVNGDGYADVIVGANRYSSDLGRAYIYFGGSAMDNVADVIMTGEAANSNFGFSVSTAGDVNGDGYPDVIVGAYSYSTSTGRAYIYFGGSTMNNVADVIMTGEATSNYFGSSVSTAGDVNGDGYADVIVGSQGYSTSTGRAYVYFGGSSMDNAADVIMTGEATDDVFGHSVSTAGDVNGDGYADVIVSEDGYSSSTGRAFVYFGGSAMDNNPDVVMTGEATNDFFSYSVAAAGDVNGDGYADVIAGATAYSTATGRAYLYLSSSPPVIPRIASIKDVPFDQGGQIRVRWYRSGYDVQGTGRLAEYVLERSDPPGSSGLMWDYVATIPALRQTSYSYVTPTPSDSSTGSNGTFYFRVIARGTNPDELWPSSPLSGHSVDNLAPLSPSNTALAALSTTKLRLRWDKDLVDHDVGHYAVYRSQTDGFPLVDSTRWAMTTDSVIVDSTFAANATYYYRITTVDIHGNESVPSGELYSPNALSSKADVRILLEGAYNSGTQLMNKSLRTGGFLSAHFAAVPIPVDAVDSINIELRNAVSASASSIRKFRPAWLLTDGTIRDFADTTANYVTFDTLAGVYYLVISHRNHIAVLTATALSLNGAQPLTPYDFTTSQSQAYGTNPMKAVVGGRFALIAGDASGNGQVATSDVNSMIRPRLGQSGYQNADINLNGQIQTSDINTYTRPNIGKGTQVPTSPVQGTTKKENGR